VGWNATAETVFEVNCVQPISPTVIEVATETTGQDPDTNGYALTIENQPQYISSRIGINEALSFAVSGGGSYEVELADLSPNCDLDTALAPNPRTVSVNLGDTVRTTFSVTCSPWGAIRVSVETGGWDLDPDGYRVFLENTTWTSNIDINGEHTFGFLTPGSYTAALDPDRITKNCVVQVENPTGDIPINWGDTVDVSFAVRCSGIVFQSGRDGFTELYVMNSDGTGVERILSGTHEDVNPAWAPDRTKVVFSSNRDGDWEIYVLTLADTSLTQLTGNTSEDDDPVWSPHGDAILFSSKREAGNQDLYLMSDDGQGTVRRITTAPGEDDDPDWSPVDPAGGTAEWIVFTSHRDGNDELYKLDISQDPLPAPIRLTFNDVKDDDAVWSPDGTKIAFARVANAINRDIFVMNADGTGVVRLTNDFWDDADPSWSPDGTMLAFSSDRNGNLEIYVMNADGTGRVNLTQHGSPDGEPGWRR
jgi:Tol biopolymer transport system component